MTKKIRVAFSGSGFLAGLHAGAISALYDHDYEIVQAAGTSGGSILAAAVAYGMKQDELYTLAVNSDWSNLLSLNLTTLLGGAYCNGNNLLDFLEHTFNGSDLSACKIPVQILATDVKAGKSFTFNNSTNCSIGVACRSSSSVPFVYEPVSFEGRVLVDGGVVNNIPLDRLTVDALPRIGLDVSEPSSYAVSPVWSLAASLVSLLLASNENNIMHLEKSTGAKVIKLPAGNVSFLDTGMTFDQKHTLFTSGYDAVKNAIMSGVL